MGKTGSLCKTTRQASGCKLELLTEDPATRREVMLLVHLGATDLIAMCLLVSVQWSAAQLSGTVPIKKIAGLDIHDFLQGLWLPRRRHPD